MTAYWIGRARVSDRDACNQFVDATNAVVARHGGKVLIRSADCTVLDGSSDCERHLIVEFPSREKAEACFNSEEYRKARHDRIAGNAGDVQAIVVYWRWACCGIAGSVSSLSLSRATAA